MLMVHTCPLEQAGIGDAGGMNIYVAESAARMAAQGVEVDIFTRRDHLDLPEVVELSPGVNVHHLDAGHDLHWTKEQVPAHFNELTAEFKKALSTDQSYDLIHSHYWLSGKVAMPVAKDLKLPLVHTMHTMARVKNLNLAEGETPEPMIRVQGETQIVAAASALTANTDAEAASLVSLYDACPDTVHVVTPGVDLYNFTPGAGRAAARKAIGIEADTHVITFVGRIQPHKGPEILIRAIAEARAHGDLSENAEYHAARERQSFIEGRIAELEAVIPSVEVIDSKRLTGNQVRFGAYVTIVDEESDDEKNYRIVGQYEADMKNGSISVSSPLAKALMGRKVGDSVEVPAPGGSRSVEITAVRFN